MASIRAQEPTPVAAPPPLPSHVSSKIDLLVSLHLWAWPALTVAIQNAWGGSPQVSQDKRDWLAGAVSELLTSQPPQLSDVSDLEEVLLQVMVDEFEVVVDDDSAEETARKIWKGADKIRQGDVSELEQLYTRWQERQAKGEQKIQLVKGRDEEGEETDWDEDEEAQWNGLDDRDQDIELNDAPPTIDAGQKQKIEPEVDEDGFTKVVSKKKR
jgi:pre-rRNA-processing protein TSR2